MIVNKKDFYETLKQLEPAITTKELIDGASNIVFSKDKIFTFNDNILCLIPYESDLEFAVPADGFIKFFSKSKAKEIELIHEDQRIEIFADKTTVTFNVQNQVEVMDLVEKIDIPKEFDSIPTDLLKAIKKCSQNIVEQQAGNDVTDYLLVCENGVFTANERCCSTHEISASINTPIFLSPNVCKRILSYKIVSYAMNDAWVFFKDESDFIFACRMFNGEPDGILQSIEYYEFDGDSFISPDMAENVEISGLFSKSEDKLFGNTVIVTIQNDKLTISCKNMVGKFQAEFDLDSDLDIDYEFSFPIESLRQISGKEIKIDKDLSRILMVDDKYKFLMAIPQKRG